MKLQDICQNKTILRLDQIYKDPELIKQIQIRLAALGFYDMDKIDGQWGPHTEQGVKDFCVSAQLDNYTHNRFGPTFAKALIEAKPKWDISFQTVAHIIGCGVKNVQKYMPDVVRALKEHGLYSKPTLIATLATIGVETGTFEPITEEGGPEYLSQYDFRSDLGNVHPGDGVKYAGRGFLQVTGFANYALYSQKLGVDLIGNPDLALDSDVASQILALYFKDRNIPALAEQGDWQGVRRAVNGGLSAWSEFISYVNQFEQILR